MRLQRIRLPTMSMWGGGMIRGLLIMVVVRIKNNNQPKMIGKS